MEGKRYCFCQGKDSAMIRRTLCVLVLLGLLLNLHVAASACGPSYLEPIFIFQGSPDLPFEDFTAGKIGIVRPTFGRKTLLIAYRYLNGGAFSASEQKDLVMALKDETPQEEMDKVVESWINTRKELLNEVQPPALYTERRVHNSYTFFPNCTQNAFEVATATLKDRVVNYGADDPNVREWLHGQDEVFNNCAANEATLPAELGPGVPIWLRKDRDYQIAAALFYSMQFDEAKSRFEKIAADGQSDWQSTAEYLVPRTLVRQASLIDPLKQAALYAEAETRLQTLVATGNKFRDASRKLLGLVKYRLHPEERTGELADLISFNGASLDLRQDVIDYIWLIDKFEGQVLRAENDRREALKKKETLEELFTLGRRYDEPDEDDELRITFIPRFADNSYDYEHTISLKVKPDVSESEVLRLVEQALNRAPRTEEANDIKSQFKMGAERRQWFGSYNRKLSLVSENYEGCYGCFDIKLKLEDLPSFLIAHDLTDWIFTLQFEGPETYAHAVAQWRQTDSPAWLLAALVKAEITSPGLSQLMKAAQRISQDSVAFPTIAYHLVRLHRGLGQTSEAQNLLDRVFSQFDQLPVSAQNSFREEQVQMAKDLSQFLKYAALKPAAFYEDGLFVSIRDMVESKKEWWSSGYFRESKEAYEERIEESYKDLLSEDVRLFDDPTNDILDRHLPLQLLQQAAKDSQVPAYLRRRLTLNVWTRAILLDNREVAVQVTPEVIKFAPRMTTLLNEYLDAKNETDRRHAALFVLLKFPDLTPFLSGAFQRFPIYQDSDYYFESAWWCEPSETEYREAQEVPKVVPAPPFVDAHQLEIAKREYAALSEIGDASGFLGKQVLQWAAESPDDARIPEALFIAFAANQSYKYGCNGWNHDEELQQQVSTLLHERYPQSPWTAKLTSLEAP
jgi:hypothetical protein